MKRSWWLRFSLLLGLIIFSGMLIVPSFVSIPESSSYPFKKKVNLGLDLQGGLYMVLGIDFLKVYQDEMRTYMRKMEYVLNDRGIKAHLGEQNFKDAEDPKMSIVIDNPADLDKAKAAIKDYFAYPLRATNMVGQNLEYGLNRVVKDEVEKTSVSKSIEVIRNRIDEFGVTEPEIISQGKNRIVVQLPGVKDIERAKGLIGRTAKLEFKLVKDDVPMATLEQWVQKGKTAGIEYKKGESFNVYAQKLNDFLVNDLPKGFMISFQKKINKHTNELEMSVPYLVDQISKLGGDDLQDARVQIDQQNNNPYVSMTFKSQGAKTFGDITGKNVGRRLAVILDSNVYTAPVIQQAITGGNAQITLGMGNYNELLEQARDIALVLRAGALPVQLEFEEQRVVGPSLGADSIKKATMASLLACLGVFLFCFIYYRTSGFLTVITLCLNALFLVGGLVMIDATLTVPGIAGIALTIGMAVDANIIIFERIKEEVAHGISNQKAVMEGFGKAFWTILDANLTTAMAGFCLLHFGTGPIRGFAVTLLIGIVSTVYTAFFVSHILFEFYMDKVEGKELSI